MRPELTKMTTLPQSWWVKYRLRMMLQWLKLSQPSNLTGPWNHIHRMLEEVRSQSILKKTTSCQLTVKVWERRTIPYCPREARETLQPLQVLTLEGSDGITFFLHLPQDNSHSEWKNSGHSITCNKSRGRGRGVGRQRTELLRTYSCYKAISEKNWNIKN